MTDKRKAPPARAGAFLLFVMGTAGRTCASSCFPAQARSPLFDICLEVILTLLSETGFTYNGIHSRRDMGLIYAEKDGHQITPKINRNEYKIAGASGSILFDGETWDTLTFEGTLYPAIERSNQWQAQQLLRQVAAWLTAGRKQLIFDYEPSVYYMAELSGATRWSLKNWFGGEIGIKFDAQPYAYNVTPDSATISIDQDHRTNYITPTVSTGHPAPLQVTIYNAGSGTITDVQVGVLGRELMVYFSGLSLGAGQTMTLNFEAPAGATIDGVNVLPYCTIYNPIYLGNGMTYVYVGVNGSGSYSATITVQARGRW